MVLQSAALIILFNIGEKMLAMFQVSGLFLYVLLLSNHTHLVFKSVYIVQNSSVSGDQVYKTKYKKVLLHIQIR